MIIKRGDDGICFNLTISPDEYDKLLAGIYCFTSSVKSEFAEKMHQEMIEALSLRNPEISPQKMGLTLTQKDQVQKMIENYALKVEKRREKIVKQFRERLAQSRLPQDGNPFDTRDKDTVDSDLHDFP